MECTHSGSLFHAQFIPFPGLSHPHPIYTLPQNDHSPIPFCPYHKMKTLPPHNYENSTPFSPDLKVNKLPPHLAPTPKLWELHPF